MPGTQRTISYFEGKFETGDIPTQEDFYDLFASFLHYLQVKQVTGSSTTDLMSQKAVTDAIVASSGRFAIDITYADIAAMLADQGNQTEDAWYLVQDASADATVDSGWAIYQILSATTGALSDYIKIVEQEGLDVALNNGSETVKGVFEEATDVEVNAGTAVGATGAKLTITPAKFITYINAFLAAAHAWAAKQTFTSAPRFDSVTASQFLKVDGSKDLVSVAAASQAEMIAGTDDTKPATPLSMELKRSVKTVLVSPPGSGGTLTLDCLGKQEVKFEFNAVANYNFTIALSNETNIEYLSITARITGTSVISMPSTFRMEKAESRWNNTSKALTLIGGTDEPFEISCNKKDGPKYLTKATTVYHA